MLRTAFPICGCTQEKKKKMRIHSIKNSVFCGFSCLPFLILLRLRLGAFYSSFSTSAACLRWMEPPCGVPWKMKKCEGKRGIARKSKYDIKSWTMWQSEGGFCRPQQTTNCIRLAGLLLIVLTYLRTYSPARTPFVCLSVWLALQSDWILSFRRLICDLLL